MPRSAIALRIALALMFVLTVASPAWAAQVGEWVAPETRGEVGHSRFLVVTLDQPADADATFELTVTPAEAVEVLEPLTVLKGYAIAYARVRPLVAGMVTIRVPALAEIACSIDVRPATPRMEPVELLTPKPGAALWGEVWAGARFTGMAPRSVALFAGDVLVQEVGRDAIEYLDEVWRPIFNIDAATLPAGPVALTVDVTYPDGSVSSSDPVVVEITHADADSPMAPLVFEAEMLAAQPLPEGARPNRQPSIARDAKASGGAMVSHAASDPPTRMAVEGGRYYQMAVVARGQYASGAWPTVGIWRDNSRQLLYGYGQILGAQWHRVLIGAPVYVPFAELDGESRYLVARFMNDAYARNLYDRNLYLDRVELLPLEARVVDMQADLIGRARELANSMGELNARRDAIEAEAQPLLDELAQMLETIATAEQRQTEAVAGIVASQAEIDSLHAANLQLLSDYRANRLQIEVNQQRITDLQTEIEVRRIGQRELLQQSERARQRRDEILVEGSPLLQQLAEVRAVQAARMDRVIWAVQQYYALPDETSGSRHVDASNARISLLTRFDGVDVCGPLWIDAIIARERRQVSPPASWLELNGERIDVQYSDRPRFRVGTDVMQVGENTLRVVMDVGAGVERATATHTFTWRGDAAMPDGLPDAWHRICATQPGWEGTGAEQIRESRPARNAPDNLVFGWSTNHEASIELPAQLSGNYELYLYAYGERFEGDPVVRVALDGELVADTNCPPGWRDVRVGVVNLSPTDGVGQRLSIAFINDHYAQGRGDRNVFVGAVQLRPVISDAAPPTVTWQYPKAGATIALADAAVFDVADASGILDVTLFIDGQRVPGGYDYRVNRPNARMCLPFGMRNLDVGEHTMHVEVRDRFRNITRTEPITVIVSHDPADSPFEAAAHLLNRFGYGPEPFMLGQVLVDGPEVCLRRWLQAKPDQVATALVNSRFTNLASVGQAWYRVLVSGQATINPVRYRVTQFFENHFSTWAQKVGGARDWLEYMDLDRVSTSTFGDLLRTSASSPSMLVYLDQHTSFAGRINENYAREIMELHTLGVAGGYTQADVEALARVLTGLSRTTEDMLDTYTFVAGGHDISEQVVVGSRFEAIPRGTEWDERAALSRDAVERALELLLAHPSTARFIARKLVEHYVAVPAPAEAVDAVTRRFHETDGDIVELLLTIAALPEFTANAFSKGTDPLEYGMRLQRCGEYLNSGQLLNMLRACDRLPLDRVTPDGFPEADASWFDSAAMLQRWRFSEDTANGARNRLFHGYVRGRGVEFDDAMNQALIDYAAVRLTGRLLTAESNTAMLEIMATAQGDANTRVGLALSLIGQLPEANMH